MEEGIIRVEAKFSKQFFPKFDEHVGEGDFAIISWEVLNVEEGDPQLHSFFNTITTKGNMPNFSRLDTYTIIARESPSDFGMQYDLIYIGQPADMTTIEAQRAFLSRILTETQVENLFDTFDSPITPIQNHDIEELCKVSGIGKTTAESIIEKYEDNKDLSQVYIELDGYGLTNRMIQKLVDRYGSPQSVIDKVKTNPYQLASEVDGIGFKKADTIALESGLEWDSIYRIKGFIAFTLETRAEDGDSYIYANDLMYAIEDELGAVGSEKIGKSVNEMVEDKIIGLLEGSEGGHKKVYLQSYYELEKSVARELNRLLGAPNHFEFSEWESKVKLVEKKQGWVHVDEQVKGIKGVLEEQVYIVNGLAGSGKTSVVTAMLEALDAKSGKYKFGQTALSGRASAKLQEVTGSDGMTIHRLLGYDEERQGFKHHAGNRLPLDLIILDEISLVGGRIFLDLLLAIRTGAKLVILGDDGQLESIGCMNLARDLINSVKIPSVELTQIHRQAARSGIITEASKIRNHEQLCERGFTGTSIRGELQDFELNIIKDLTETRPTMVNYFKEWLPKVDSVMDIQLLVPINERGDACVDKLNTDIQEIYNPPNPRRREQEVVINKKKDKKFIIREMDKLMIMKNNYKTKDEDGVVTPVFNGWVGTVRSIQDNESVVVYFEIIDKDITLSKSFLTSVRLGYACSSHKFQGSGCEVIISGIDYSTPPFMRTKELVYTMVTRAEKYCILVAQEPALREAIDTSGVAEKNTFLTGLLDK